ncbi:hypothetical protein P5487_005980 [Bacillus amyloliquefaciens]|uniref:hypothetical protein n=1 Tax=Bacillus amyloliquefaciens TaxID=1390 RepID=UPI00118631E4|nr:hypothetical protein [Bacillus amyloliquefaciens]MDH3089661.1 hypothetical protein [Bacillus amyloliquefaciens]
MSVNIEQISSVVKTLNNKVNNATVLFFNNFWEDPIKQIEILPQSQLIFGFPGAGGGTVGANTINGAFTSIIMIGDIGTASKERVQQVYTLFKQAGFSVKRQANFKKFLLNHFLLNVAIEMEGNNTITGRSAKLILDEARRKNMHIYILENIRKLLP